MANRGAQHLAIRLERADRDRRSEAGPAPILSAVLSGSGGAQRRGWSEDSGLLVPRHRSLGWHAGRRRRDRARPSCRAGRVRLEGGQAAGSAFNCTNRRTRTSAASAPLRKREHCRRPASHSSGHSHQGVLEFVAENTSKQATRDSKRPRWVRNFSNPVAVQRRTALKAANACSKARHFRPARPGSRTDVARRRCASAAFNAGRADSGSLSTRCRAR